MVDLKLKTKEGLGEPFALTDIQENNRLLRQIVTIGWVSLLFVVLITLYVLWKVIHYDILGNILRSLG